MWACRRVHSWSVIVASSHNTRRDHCCYCLLHREMGNVVISAVSMLHPSQRMSECRAGSVDVYYIVNLGMLWNSISADTYVIHIDQYSFLGQYHYNIHCNKVKLGQYLCSCLPTCVIMKKFILQNRQCRKYVHVHLHKICMFIFLIHLLYIWLYLCFL